ncbi:hypothetical protein [Rhodococcus sp. IEGM 1379]|uniref:hypothetical protein n=1 Tax=Rhodococcus sp. IEGM 1379 TaxID=3047086 RepID=UPI0024B712E3|nr:hypothetical protein [Rhodococcus sp. IEGM 1379]MDI9913757.1 hypothetical protein [Rhodococcus sp. IEGM 1379]
MNGLETPATWSRTAALFGTGALAVAITLGGAVGTASADSPVTDFSTNLISVPNTADNTVVTATVTVDLPTAERPFGVTITPAGALGDVADAVSAYVTQAVNASIAALAMIQAGAPTGLLENFGSPGSSGW